MPAPPPLTLEGTRLFARIRAIDFECPRCGRLAVIRSFGRLRNNTPGWDSRSGTYRCPGCAIVVMLGTLLYPVSPGSKTKRTIPDDWIPNPRQAAEIRQLQTAIYLDEMHRRSSNPTLPRNARGPACRCLDATSTQGGTLPHPACPIHRGGPGQPVAPAPTASVQTANAPAPINQAEIPDLDFEGGGFVFPGPTGVFPVCGVNDEET